MVDAKIWINELANRRGKSRANSREVAEALANGTGMTVLRLSHDPATGELRREIIRPEDFFAPPHQRDDDGQG